MMARFLDPDASELEIETEPKPRRGRTSRSRKKPIQTAIQDPPMPSPHGYHPRPAKSALKAANLPYEPPYESASMPIGQRAEHPEYDTGHPVARPTEIYREEREAA